MTIETLLDEIHELIFRIAVGTSPVQRPGLAAEADTQIRALRAAVEAVKVEAWQTIDTAPVAEYLYSDGDEILLLFPDGEIRLGHTHRVDNGFKIFVSNNGDYTDGGYGNDYVCGNRQLFEIPTHWMPLPKPPGESA